MLDTKQSYQLLRMSFSLLTKIEDKYKVAESVGRDLYDFVQEHTTDPDLRYQISEANQHFDTRIKCLRYLNHRLNIDLT